MKKTLENIDFEGKKVLVRLDFNVPMEGGRITDDTRIKASLPTIQYILDHKASLILMSHLGRPKGEAKEEFSLAPIGQRLGELLSREVIFLDSDQVVDDDVRAKVKDLKPGDLALLQNTRFRKEEKENDPDFAKDLASLADIYVNDAFGTAHRAHASTEGVARLLPSAMGRLIEKEVTVMGGALEDPARPFLAILGGAKVSDKILVIENLLNIVDTILIGGGMAYTFLKAQGKEVGKSLVEEDKIDYARDLLKEAEEKKVKILLPVDNVCAKDLDDEGGAKVCPSDEMDPAMMGLDIGPKTIDAYSKEIKDARTIIWNGPMGVFEKEAFSKGSFALAEAMADTEATTIVGGGDTALAVEKAGVKDKMSHVSTGGGASLQFLEGKGLEAIEAIDEVE